MDIGIGLPNAVRGVDRDGIVEWARRAEAAGFSSLGTIDRIAYANYESLIALAAAAAVTERIRLVTDIMIAPLRANTALLAKQSATIDHLSGGRLVLGLAPGGREDDYALSGVDFHRRGPPVRRAARRAAAAVGGGGRARAGPGVAGRPPRAPHRRRPTRGRIARAAQATPTAGPRAAGARRRSPAGPRGGAGGVEGRGPRRRAAHDGAVLLRARRRPRGRRRAPRSATTTRSSASTPT